MPNISIQITASTVAWYGAITATIALTIELAKLWLDRRHVKLEILPEMHFLGSLSPRYPEDTGFVIFKVINKGKRPVTINQHGVKLKDGSKHLVVIPPAIGLGALPKEILDGQDYAVYGVFNELRERSGGFEKIEFFYVIDATGKMHKRKMSRKLLKDFQDKIKRRQSAKTRV